jgi:hypothetical protein
MEKSSKSDSEMSRKDILKYLLARMKEEALVTGNHPDDIRISSLVKWLEGAGCSIDIPHLEQYRSNNPTFEIRKTKIVAKMKEDKEFRDRNFLV